MQSAIESASEKLMNAHLSDIDDLRLAFSRLMRKKGDERAPEKTNTYLMGAMDSLDLFETMIKRMDAFAKSAPGYVAEPREVWYTTWAQKTIQELKETLRLV